MSSLIRKFHAFNKAVFLQFTLGVFIFGGMIASIVLASKPQDIRQQASTTNEVSTSEVGRSYVPTYVPDPNMACNNIFFSKGAEVYINNFKPYLQSYGWANFYSFGNTFHEYENFPDADALNLGPKDQIVIELHGDYFELSQAWPLIQKALNRKVTISFFLTNDNDGDPSNPVDITSLNHFLEYIHLNIRAATGLAGFHLFDKANQIPGYNTPYYGYVTDTTTKTKKVYSLNLTTLYNTNPQANVYNVYETAENQQASFIEESVAPGAIVRVLGDEDELNWPTPVYYFPDDHFELSVKFLSCFSNGEPQLTPGPSVSSTPTIIPSKTPIPTETPSNTPTQTPSKTPTKTPTRTPTPTATPVPISCNFYSAGNFADVLTGYTDPAVKILKQLGAINKGKYFGSANKSAFNAKDLSDGNFLVYFTFSSAQKMDKVSNQVNAFLNQGKHVLLVTDGTEGSTGQYTSGANQYLLPVGRRYAGNTSFGLFNLSETTLTNPKLRGLRQMYLTSASKVTDTTASGTNTFPPVKKYTCQYTMSTNPNWCLWGEIEFTNGARLDLLTSAASVGGGADPSAQPLGTQLLGKYVSQTCSATCGNHICEVGESAPCPSGAQCVWTGSCPSDCGGR